MTDLWSNPHAATIPQLVHAAARQWPHKTYLDFSGQKYTYAETEREAARFAHGLRAIGVKRGDRVCALLDNTPDFVFAWFGVNMLGAIFVPINTDMKGEFLRHQVVNAAAEVMIAEADYCSRVLDVTHGLPDLHTLISRGALPEMPSDLTIIPLDRLRADDTSVIEGAAHCKDVALLIYTSGTTGPSKGCMIGHSYAHNFGAQCVRMVKMLPEDVVFTPCPLFHAAAAFGVMAAVLQIGATAAIVPRFSASNFWPEVERSGATVALLLSVMLTIVPNGPDSDAAKRYHGRLRSVWGAPVNNALKAAWQERFAVKHVATTGFGMTEVCIVTAAPIDTPNVPDGASGRRFEDFDVRIVDGDGNECPPDVAGEIVVRPRRPGIMFQGYWCNPEATLAAFSDLWFHTGDVGKFDRDGFFYFVDRKKDYIRKGGENVSSFEMEATFLSHPDVAEAAVYALKSELSEDEIKVSIVLKHGVTVSAEELCRWSVDRLPHFAVPRYIDFRTHFQRTPSGRIQKYLLRDEGVTPTTWDRKQSTIVVSRR